MVTLLLAVPSAVPFTSTVIVQVPSGKLEVLLKLTLPAPALAVTDPPQVLVTLGVAATARLAGSVSVKLPLIVTTFGLLTLKLSVETPLFTAIRVGLKLFVIEGGCSTTMLAVTVA